ncbi:MAG: hypothetical protein BZ135_01865 [Methanosphaera sp. rholeuAM6]|nr:MAG: hypothetical protein BZ135_01865 [Methanosphaera sp. rholeuAM6]
MNTDDVSKIAKALSEPKRIEILMLTTDNEMCANHILERFNITQPTLSHHMKMLTDCELLNIRKDGKMCYYSTNRDTINEFRKFFEKRFE